MTRKLFINCLIVLVFIGLIFSAAITAVASESPSPDYIAGASSIIMAAADGIYEKTALEQKVPRILSSVVDGLARQLEGLKARLDDSIDTGNWTAMEKKTMAIASRLVSNMVKLLDSLTEILDGRNTPETRRTYLEIRKEVQADLKRLEMAKI